MPIPRIPSRVKWYLSYGNQHSFVKGIKLAYIYLEPNTSSNTCIHDTTLKKSLGIFKGWFLKISPACQEWTMAWYSQRNQWPQLVRTNMVFRIDWRWRLSVSQRLYALHQFHWGYTRLTSHGKYFKPLTQTILIEFLKGLLPRWSFHLRWCQHSWRILFAGTRSGASQCRLQTRPFWIPFT